MKNSQIQILSGSDATTQTGPAIDVGQAVSASFSVQCSDATGAGTLKIQACNDLLPTRTTTGAVILPTNPNWIDIPNASVVQGANTKQMIVIPNMCFSLIRAVWTQSAAGSGTVTVNMNVLSI